MSEEKTEPLEDLTFDLDEMLDKAHQEKVLNPLMADEGLKTSEKSKENQDQTMEEDAEDDKPVERSASRKEDKETEKEKGIDYKAEWEKAQKAIKDTQKSFHEDRKKLAAYKKAVEKLKNDGVIIEEEANLLLDHTKYEDETQDVPLLTKYYNIWDKEINDMRAVYEKGYINKPDDFEQQIMAFQHFISTASSKEIEDTLDEFSSFEDDPIKLTKKMLEVGRQYNDDIYSDIRDAGGIRNLKSFYFEKQQEMQKRIDNLEEKNDKLKKKYEDYDNGPPRKGIPSGAGNFNNPKFDKVDLDAFFDSIA
jgi:cell division protein FtsB